MKLTADMLRAAEVAERHVTWFTQLFPDGCEPTEELCAQYPLVNYHMVAGKLLPADKKDKFFRVASELLDAFIVDTAEMRKAYDERSRGASMDAQEGLWDKYVQATAPQWAEYEAARARAFGRIWSEHETDS